MYDIRRTDKLIYPPLSSIRDEEPKRSLLPDGRLLYQSVHMDSELDDSSRKYEYEPGRNTLYFANHYKHYDDGTFAVFSRNPFHDHHIFRI